MPAPRPRFEIFVYSPRVEGVHLRFGPVARGGLRWSDRPQDYRTEILGLVKAQAVKNAVIVPVGAKGGFVVRRADAGPEEVECLLPDVHLRAARRHRQPASHGDGGTETVPPPDVVRHDGDDSYLVVAADKGTAKFSDTANEVAASYGFWLGDAFASGGSVGYDHKAMGITAKGAWESVKRHFRELGVDTQSRGVHRRRRRRHVRRRVRQRHAALRAHPAARRVRPPARVRRPRPGRRDVASPSARGCSRCPARRGTTTTASLISAGGGVWPRTAKSVPVGAEMRAALGPRRRRRRELSPPELIAAILRAPGRPAVERRHRHLRQGVDRDRTPTRATRPTTRIRADGARAAGQGRRRGRQPRADPARPHRVRPRTAARSTPTRSTTRPGVDCSDHEVNIKILLDRLVAAGELDRDGAQRAARVDDRRGRRAGARRQPRPERACSASPGRTPPAMVERARAARRRPRRRATGSTASWRCCPTTPGSPRWRPRARA